LWSCYFSFSGIEVFVDIIQDLLKIALEDFVKTVESTMGGKGAAIEVIAIQDCLGYKLFFNTLKPLSLDRSPFLHSIYTGHGVVDAILVTDQGIAQGLPSDEGDNVSSNLLVFPVLPGNP
jgi:hypothetical protein